MSWTSNTDGASGVSRLGLKSGGSDNRALFLKQFSGEVLTSFEEKNVAMPLHRVRTISNGKSAQFPSIGTTTADYHTAGTQIFGDSVPASEITVTVDDLLVSSAFIPKIDEAMNHYDVRSIYSKEMGNALANAADRNIFATIYSAATGASNGDQQAQWVDADFTGLGVSGGRIDLTTPASEGHTVVDAQDVVDGIINSLMTFDKHDVTGEKYCVLNPETYYLLMGADTTAINRDQGGNGSVAEGRVPTVGGVQIHMSNHLPLTGAGTTTPSAESGRGTDIYTAPNNTNLKGLIFTKDAAATVKLLDLGVESEYQIERQGTLMVAKYAMGHNVLRNKSAIALVA
jgi:hypothetical protein